MSHARRWLMTVAAGLVALLILSEWAALEPLITSRRSELAVAPHAPITLTSEGLPDAIVSLQLQQRIIRLGWERAQLSIDLLIDVEGRQTDALWRDLAALYRFSFAETDNVKQTLVRIYQETANGRTLLFYGDPQRADWPAERLAKLRLPSRGEEASFQEAIDLSATPAGIKWMLKV